MTDLRQYHLGDEEVWLERWLFRFRPLMLALFALVTAVLGYQLSTLTVDASFEKMLPMEHPFLQNMYEHYDDLPKGSSLVVKIAVEHRDGDIFDKQYMETLQQIHDEVFYLDGVDRNSLRSLWSPNVRWIEVTPEGFEGGPVIPNSYIGDSRSLDQLRENVLRSGEVGRLVADNFQSSIVEFSLLSKHPDTGEPIDFQAFSQRLEEKVREQYGNDNIRIYIIGLPKMLGDLIDGFVDIGLFALIALAITFVLLFLYTNCWYSALIPLGCSVVAVVWQLGLLPTLGLGLGVFSVLVPFLVFAIGVSHGVQVVNGVALATLEGADKLQAAKRAFRSLYIPGMIALVSDAIGFMTMLMIDIQAIRELGIAASIGVAVVILTNLILLPILLSYTGLQRSGVERIRDRQRRYPQLWLFLARFTTRRYALASVVIAALGAAWGVYESQDLKIGDLDRGAPELQPDSRYNLDNAFITDHYSTSSDLFMVMMTTEPEGCAKTENLAAMDQLEWTLLNVDGVESVISPATIVKKVIVGMNEGNLKWYNLSRNQGVINSTFNRVSEAGLINAECSFAPVIAFLADHRAETLERVVDAVQAFSDEYNTENREFLLATGSAGIAAAVNEEIARAQWQMMALVYGVVALLVLITFRSLATLVCILVPLIITSILCQALMANLGIGVKVATLPVIALGVGVGVDYGIYIFSRLKTFLEQGLPLKEAYLLTLRTTGRAVAFTGFTLAIGVATWIFSAIKFQADMGILLTFMFLWNMIGALWLIPALAHFLVPTRRFDDDAADRAA